MQKYNTHPQVSQISLLELLERDTRLNRVASTQGGEYAGPCPFCGGDDRFRVWPDAERPHYWCRRCGKRGDAISYLREHDGLSFREACRWLGLDPGKLGIPRQQPAMTLPEQPLTSPPPAWQERASEFCHQAMTCLWSPSGYRARTSLRERGLKEGILRSGMLGCHLIEEREPPQRWGIEADRLIPLPAGIVIPTQVGGLYWRVNIRRWMGGYLAVSGSCSALYRVDILGSEKPILLLESELDALLVQQEAGDLVATAATGGRVGARHPEWRQELAGAPAVLIAYDADAPGDEASPWWIAHLPNARRVRPLAKDPTEMWLRGFSVRDWVQQAVAS